MMVRLGFVSNSSSSSFIVHIKKLPPCPHCGRKDPDILKMLPDNKGYADETGIRSKSKNEILKRYKDNYDDNKLYNELKSKIETLDPGTIAEIEVQYGEETIIDMIKNTPGVTVIKEIG